MAILAMIVADNQHLRQHAETVMATIQSLNLASPSDDVAKAKIELIYHTAFGDLDEAVDAGARNVELERRGGNSASLLKALRWWSRPLRLTSQADKAKSVLAEAYERASRLGLRAELSNVLHYIQSLALDCEDLELATEWLPVIADLSSDATVHVLRIADYTYFAARIAYLRGEFAAARGFLDRARGLQTAIPRVRGEQSILALDIVLRCRTGQSVPRRLLSRLHRLHLRSRDSGLCDFEAAALLSGLEATGATGEAMRLLGDYLRLRRIRLPLDSTLLDVQRRLGAERANL